MRSSGRPFRECYYRTLDRLSTATTSQIGNIKHWNCIQKLQQLRAPLNIQLNRQVRNAVELALGIGVIK